MEWNILRYIKRFASVLCKCVSGVQSFHNSSCLKFKFRVDFKQVVKLCGEESCKITRISTQNFNLTTAFSGDWRTIVKY